MQIPDYTTVRVFDTEAEEWAGEFAGTSIPIPDVGEEVRVGREDLQGASMAELSDAAPENNRSKYRVENRVFQYTRRDLEVEFDAIDTRITITDVRLDVVPVTEDDSED